MDGCRSQLGRPSAQFAAMGDDEGLLIFSDRERCWFPEGRQRPNGTGLRLTVQAAAGQGAVIAEEGWKVRAV